MSAKIRLTYLQQLFRLPVCVLDTLPSGQASNTLTNTANILQVGISEKLGMFLQFTALFVTALIIAFVYSWALTLVTSSVLLFIVIVYSVTIPINMKLQREVDHADEKAAGIAGEVLGSIRMIVACGAEGRIAKKYSGWVQESRRRGGKLAPYIGAQFAPRKYHMFVYSCVNVTNPYSLLHRLCVSTCLQVFGLYLRQNHSAMAICFWYGFKLYVGGHVHNVGDIVTYV